MIWKDFPGRIVFDAYHKCKTDRMAKEDLRQKLLFSKYCKTFAKNRFNELLNILFNGVGMCTMLIKSFTPFVCKPGYAPGAKNV